MDKEVGGERERGGGNETKLTAITIRSVVDKRSRNDGVVSVDDEHEIWEGGVAGEDVGAVDLGRVLDLGVVGAGDRGVEDHQRCSRVGDSRQDGGVGRGCDGEV